MTPLSQITLRRFFLELLIVILAGLIATRAYQNSDPNLSLAGGEAQTLTSSAYVAWQSLQTTGHLSLWNPWLAHGEPSIDSAFAFTLNPLSMAPSLMVGPENGIKYSVVLYGVFVGLGGWLLARMLNLGTLGRLVLAIFMIGRGGLNSVVSFGYFQLGVTQAYLPWVAAATLAIIRYRTRRWPIVLLAVMLTLLFWGGNIYYTLPALIIVALLTLAFLVSSGKGSLRSRFDWRLLARVAAALALTLGLAAMALIPIFASQKYIGAHPDEDPKRIYELPVIVASEFFTTERYSVQDSWNETYFNYAAPLWFAALLFVVLPLAPGMHQSPDAYLHRRIVIVALFMIIFFLTWGTGTNPLMKWVYAHFPLIGQWRVLSRMLTICSFWIVVLVAMRADGLWRVLVLSKRLNGWLERRLRFPKGRAHQIFASGLIVASGLAAFNMISVWDLLGSTGRVDAVTTACIRWVHDQHPNQPVAVWMLNYSTIIPFIENQVRFSQYSGDYHLVGIPSRFYNGDLRDALSEYVLSYQQEERGQFLARGYSVVVNGPLTDDRQPFPCLLRNPNTLSYAFTIPVATLRTQQTVPSALDPALTTPVTSLNRALDHVGLIVNSDPLQDQALVVQELAWPGWYVRIDGSPATLEPIGQMVGVILPRGAATHQILFAYDPPLLKLGGLITLMTAAFCALYLLNTERWIHWQRSE